MITNKTHMARTTPLQITPAQRSGGFRSLFSMALTPMPVPTRLAIPDIRKQPAATIATSTAEGPTILIRSITNMHRMLKTPSPSDQYIRRFRLGEISVCEAAAHVGQ